MNKCLLSLLFFSPLFSHAQADKKLYLTKIGWSISIPTAYKISDTLQNAGRFDQEEKWKSEDIATYNGNMLFSIEKKSLSIMSAALLPYDPSKDGEWTDYIAKSNILAFKGVLNETLTMDTSSVIEVFSGLRFTRTHIIIKFQNKIVLRAINLNRQFGDHELRISISFTEQADAEEFLNLIRKSSFRHFN